MSMKSDGRWNKVYTRVWIDEKFSSLSAPPPCGQWLWIYLLTGPKTTLIPGLCSVSEAGIAEDLHWPLKAVQSAFNEITARGMAKLDRQRRLLLIPRAIEYDPPANPNVVRGWRRVWADLPECDLKREAYSLLRVHLSERSENLVRAFDEVIERPSAPPILNGSGNGLDNGSGNGLANIEGTVTGTVTGNNSSSSSNSSKTPLSTSDTIREVFEHWQQVMHSPRSKLDSKRRACIEAALKLGYTVTDLKCAVHGCSVTPHNMGMNERGEKYNDLTLILRDAAHIDRFIANDRAPPKPPTNGNGARDAEWFRTDQGVERKARELGLAARAGESYAMLRERVQRALDDRKARAS